MAGRRGAGDAGAPVAVLLAALLFNLGQGVLRPSLPLYVQAVFRANYRMVTAIPTVFGLGRWLASLPTGWALDRVGRRPVMVAGLLVIAASDVACVLTADPRVFLGLRAVAGTGWAMFGTAATTVMVAGGSASGRGRTVSLLLMSETLGLFLGSLAGGWVYRGIGVATPFLLEAGCMLVGGLVVARGAVPGPAPGAPAAGVPHGRGGLRAVLRIRGVLPMSLAGAALVAVQTGLIVFLFPLHLTGRAGLGADTVGLLVGALALGRLAALWVGGGASDRWGRLAVLTPGLLALAALLAALHALTHPLLLLCWSLAVGGVGGLVLPVPTALVGDRAPPALHGVAIGWLRSAMDAGQILGPLIIGAVADAADLPAAFLLGAALLATTAWVCRRQEAPSVPR